MPGPASQFPEAVLLRRSDGSGYGFFFRDRDDFVRAADSFARPILRSFQGDPVPNQPDPREHLATAIATFMGQAFDRTLSADIGAEGISRGTAACVRSAFAEGVPKVVVIERKDGRVTVRGGSEFLQHPGHPLVIVVDADPHGGEARYFASFEEYRRAGESPVDARCWLPQIVYRLYSRTPSVMAGRPLRDRASGETKVEFRAVTFGTEAALVERADG